MPVALLQTGQSAKSRFSELEGYKAAIGDLTQSARSSHLGSQGCMGFRAFDNDIKVVSGIVNLTLSALDTIDASIHFQINNFQVMS